MGLCLSVRDHLALSGKGQVFSEAIRIPGEHFDLALGRLFQVIKTSDAPSFAPIRSWCASDREGRLLTEFRYGTGWLLSRKAGGGLYCVQTVALLIFPSAVLRRGHLLIAKPAIRNIAYGYHRAAADGP